MTPNPKTRNGGKWSSLYWIGWLGDLSPIPNAPVCFFFNRKMLIFFIIIFRVESDDDDSFVNGSESQDHSETASFYLGDKHIPVYASEMKELSNSDIAWLLLDPPEDKVASKPSVKCQENKIFIITPAQAWAWARSYNFGSICSFRHKSAFLRNIVT